MSYFTLVFIGHLLAYGCLCDQTAKQNLINHNLDQLNLDLDQNLFQNKDRNLNQSSIQINNKLNSIQLNPLIDQNSKIVINRDNQINQPYNSTLKTSKPPFNQTNNVLLVDLKPLSLDSMLDRIYKKNELTSNNTLFREMNIIDKKSDMQTAAGHHKHKVVEHHHHHHHGMNFQLFSFIYHLKLTNLDQNSTKILKRTNSFLRV